MALNATLGDPVSLGVRQQKPDRENGSGNAWPRSEVSRVPSGPTTQENVAGSRGQAPTYQDLLKSPSDERQFAFYTTAQVVRMGLDGTMTNIGQPGIIRSAEPSPDGKYVMIETVHTPFSYLVPVGRFPLKTEIYAMAGSLVKNLNDGPLQESVPYSRDGAPTGPRDFNWRADAPGFGLLYRCSG